MSILDYFRQRVFLEYNGVVYRLEKGDIPGLKGSGKIVVVNEPGHQEQFTEGSFSNVSLTQDGSRSFANNVNLSELVQQLEKRKTTISSAR